VGKDLKGALSLPEMPKSDKPMDTKKGQKVMTSWWTLSVTRTSLMPGFRHTHTQQHPEEFLTSLSRKDIQFFLVGPFSFYNCSVVTFFTSCLAYSRNPGGCPI